MNIAELHIEHLKLFEDFKLSFIRPDGKPYEWTILIGENGTGKTSILQAIAMAAAGQLQVNSLAGRLVSQLRDRRSDATMNIRATFSLSKPPPGVKRPHPALAELPEDDIVRRLGPSGLSSTVNLAVDETSLRAGSAYEGINVPNPLDTVRAKNTPLWFVAGYGVGRQLPDVSTRPLLNQPSIERMAPLFRSDQALTSTGFLNYFGGENDKDDDGNGNERPDKAQMYSKMLKRALLAVDSVLPGISHLELRGHGGVRKAGDLQERDRFKQRVTDDPADDVKLPLIALSHGYQSTVAWIADLIGHIVLEAETVLDLKDVRGLVLIDELDLYLHPTWQVVLVHALRKTFPGMQFVASTHSPLVLAGLRPDRDQIVRLQIDRKSGNIVRVPVEGDPRLMTGTELLKSYFNVDDIHPDAAGRDLRNYRYLAANPFRSDEDEAELKRLRARLAAQDIDPHFDPVPREAP